MNKDKQIKKAETFRALHHDPALLILPNIWDPMGARLLEGLGYPAVATASAAIAYSRGVADGQVLSFANMLDAVAAIALAVDIPVTADLEAGFAFTPDAIAENVRRSIQAGIVGVNLEDMDHRTRELVPIGEQVERLRAVRAMAIEEGIPLVINARTDVFLKPGSTSVQDRLPEAIQRASAYLEAGADCIYPILLDDLDALKQIHQETGAPLNVYASPSAPSIQELETSGISRLSLGPGFLKVALTGMKNVAEGLLQKGSYEGFTSDVISNEDIQKLVLRRQS